MKLKAQFFIERKGPLAGIAPEEITILLAQQNRPVLQKNAPKALAHIVWIGGHAPQAVRVAGVEVLVGLIKKGAHSDQFAFMEKPQMKGGRILIAGIYAVIDM